MRFRGAVLLALGVLVVGQRGVAAGVTRSPRVGRCAGRAAELAASERGDATKWKLYVATDAPYLKHLASEHPSLRGKIVGCDAYEKYVEAAWASADLDDSGKIDAEEFLLFYARVYAPAFKYGARLRKAVGRDETRMAREYIQRGCDPTGASGEGFTALHYAAQFGHVDPMKMLAERRDRPLGLRDLLLGQPRRAEVHGRGHGLHLVHARL